MHILYHNSCPDGWCAAYIAQKRYPNATLVPLNHGLNDSQLSNLFAEVRGEDVLMLDYSLRTRELNDAMNQAAKSFRILDHHKTAEAALAGADYATFDMKRSGAGLAWDYLFGKSSSFEGDGYVERPWWVDYTEDQDLWLWELPKSKEINAYLMTMPRTVEAWDEITKHDTVETAELGGIGVRRYIEYYTRSVVAEKQLGTLTFPQSFDGENCSPNFRVYSVAVLNIPYAGVSEAGHALVQEGFDIGMAWFERGDGIIQFSLRSQGDVDVSIIAKANGGGGHKHAAGFQLGIEAGRKFVDTVLGRPNYFLEKFIAPTCVK